MFSSILNHFIKITLVLFTLIGSQVIAAGAETGRQIVMQGNTKGATACLSCHGVDGAGNAAAGFPLLAGLNPDYMVKQLHDFASGARANVIMRPIAKALSTQETEQVAAYYAKQKVPYKASKVDPGLLEEGVKLVELGAWDKVVPACIQCHGPGSRGVGKHFPALAGQHARYIESQLNAWKQGTRKSDPNRLMKGIADRLSDRQIKAVAAYLASLKPKAH